MSAYLRDLGEECALVIRQLVLLAHFCAQHAGEVPGVIAGELCAIAMNPVYEKSAAGQKTWYGRECTRINANRMAY